MLSFILKIFDFSHLFPKTRVSKPLQFKDGIGQDFEAVNDDFAVVYDEIGKAAAEFEKQINSKNRTN